MEWQLVTSPGTQFFRFTWKRVTCLYSTRQGAVSFLETFRPVTLKQVHSETIVDIDVPHTGVGDGLITHRTGVHLGIKVADCLPVYLFNDRKVCIIHCGWRGMINGIAQRAARFMDTYLYALGASIGSCCYEIQDDVVRIFSPGYGPAITHRDNKYFLDLKKAVIQDLGIERLVGSLDLCTKCRPDHFYSFRGGDRDERNCATVVFGTAACGTETAKSIIECPG